MNFLDYFIAETPALRHGIRYYAGTRDQLSYVHHAISANRLWRGVFPDSSQWSPVTPVKFESQSYPLIRLDYLDFNGDFIKIRAENVVLNYMWLEHNNRWFRMVMPEMTDICWDREASPHGWRCLNHRFLGIPDLLSFDDVTLTANCYLLDDTFNSRREAVGDYTALPPAINLQCTFDEIFSPA